MEEYKYKRTFEFLALLRIEDSYDDYFYCEIIRIYNKNKKDSNEIPYEFIHKRFLEKSLHRDIQFNQKVGLYKVTLTLYQTGGTVHHIFVDYSIKIEDYEM